jgi:hypothetical protein
MNYNESKEMVNSPSHYQSSKFEVIDVIESFGLCFCLGNAIKYILRAGKKENARQDIDKAIWYLNRYKNKLP